MRYPLVYFVLGIVFLFVPKAFAIMESGVYLVSPDKRWKAWMVKHLEANDSSAEVFLSARGSQTPILLAKNERHFSAEWSPNSKILVLYNNFGSGSSFAIVFYLTKNGWKEIYTAPGDFHICWERDAWLPSGVRLRSRVGGSEPAEAPATITLHFLSKQKLPN